MSRNSFWNMLKQFRKKVINDSGFYIPQSQTGISYRSPTPGSTPEALTPKRYPEDVFFTRKYNREQRYRTPFPGESLEDTRLYSKGEFAEPLQYSSPEFHEDPEQIDKLMAYHAQSGVVLGGSIRWDIRSRNGKEVLWVSDYADPGMFPPSEYPYRP